MMLENGHPMSSNSPKRSHTRGEGRLAFAVRVKVGHWARGFSTVLERAKKTKRKKGKPKRRSEKIKDPYPWLHHSNFFDVLFRRIYLFLFYLLPFVAFLCFFCLIFKLFCYLVFSFFNFLVFFSLLFKSFSSFSFFIPRFFWMGGPSVPNKLEFPLRVLLFFYSRFLFFLVRFFSPHLVFYFLILRFYLFYLRFFFFFRFVTFSSPSIS